MTVLRQRGVDAALVLLGAVVLITSLGESAQDARYGNAACALAVLVLLLRDWRPPTAVLTCFALLAAGGRITPQATGPVFLSILASFAVAGTLPGRTRAVVGWLAGCTAILTIMVGNPYVEGVSDIGLTLTFCTIIWTAGLFAAERGRQAGAANARATLVEQRRDEELAAATAHERTRIAGELHDIVSHGLSIVILQTVAARMTLRDGRADLAEEADRRLNAVETTARDALGDMRRLLDLLRPVEGDAVADDIAPTVGLAQLPTLVSQFRGAGLRVEATYDRTGPDLPAGLDAAAYRIAQEALTNVLKHAPGAAARLRVGGDGTTLEVAVTNDRVERTVPPLHGAGYGLVGMRQRAELYGGSLEAGPCDTGFVVKARFELGQQP